MTSRRTVLIFGTFDILHPGHLFLFKEARKFGNYLIAVIARDKTVFKVKGRLPVHNEKERKEFLNHIDYIDSTVLGDTIDVCKAIRKIKPDIIALGYDQKAFVDAMKKEICLLPKEPLIVRIKPHNAHRCKTKKILKSIGL